MSLRADEVQPADRAWRAVRGAAVDGRGRGC